MKFWLIDADVIIDLLSLNIFDNLVKKHKIFAASTVISEVKYFMRSHQKMPVDLRRQYVSKDLLNEFSASIDELTEIISQVPANIRDTIDPGELESLAILKREEKLIFCSCDAAVIRILPLMNISDRGVSVEKLLKLSGLQSSNLLDRHTEEYFRSNLDIGKENKIYYFTSKKDQ